MGWTHESTRVPYDTMCDGYRFLAYRRTFLLFMTPDESDWMDEALLAGLIWMTVVWLINWRLADLF